MTLYHLLTITLFGLTACAPVTPKQTPLDAYQQWADTPGAATQAAKIDLLYQSRSWSQASLLKRDPIELATKSSAPINNAYIKILGTEKDAALESLATKLWMIDNAQYTLDLTYYIFKYDLSGKAILGALCDAVQRGVDVRIMVDSLGAIHMSHHPMLALQSCAENAGFLHDERGNPLPEKARVQFVVINSLMSKNAWSNRRSHDKLIIKDGHFPGLDMVMTGGRNISLDYYGINADGSENPHTYRDLEIILRSNASPQISEEVTIGDVSSFYYSMLFLHDGNRKIEPEPDRESYRPNREPSYDRYAPARNHLLTARKKLLALPKIQRFYQRVPQTLQTEYHPSRTRLAHELVNLKSTNVLTNAQQIKAGNANSIEGIIDYALSQIESLDDKDVTLYIVSPYLFIPRYENEKGEVSRDEAADLLAGLEQYPDAELNIITNSVLTSDNFFTQSVIDMDTAPRLLLDKPHYQQWLAQEPPAARVESALWSKLIDHPRIHIYQTGTLDSQLLGGKSNFGKLHAKFFFSKRIGFVGTSNFDYRSRLYNSEMGFFFDSPEVIAELREEYESLKRQSLRWGTPEWLEMRQKLIAAGGMKGYTTDHQRMIYNLMRGSGLIWLF